MGPAAYRRQPTAKKNLNRRCREFPPKTVTNRYLSAAHLKVTIGNGCACSFFIAPILLQFI
jgi:hypothetical protein